MTSYNLTHLKELESEAIFILREVASQFEKPVMLFSGGKDSIIMFHLARKAFFPAKIPFPLMHVDTGHNFPETLEFRDDLMRATGETLIVKYVQDSINRGTAANDGTGDNLRAGAAKINTNFDELYNVLGDGTTLLSGNYITDASTSVLTSKTINGNNNTLTNIPSSALASLPNTKLDNSTITVTGDTGSHAVDLGDTLTVEGSNGIATTITADKISIAIDGTVLTETSTPIFFFIFSAILADLPFLSLK